MRAENIITFEPMSGGRTRVIVTSYVNRRPVGQVSTELTQDAVRNLVVDLCQKAKLPRPW